MRDERTAIENALTAATDRAFVCVLDNGQSLAIGDGWHLVSIPRAICYVEAIASRVAAAWNSTHESRVTVTPYRAALITYRDSLPC